MAKTFGIDKSLGFKIDDIKYHPYSIIGKKASSLGTLVNLGLPVPSGFVLTGEAYRRFLDENDVYPNLSKPMEIPQRIRIGGTSEMLYNVIERLYREMSASHGTSRGRVIVRSSPFHIGYPDLIFEGLSETRTNISGTDQIIVAYRDVISSIFTDKEITYRQTHGISHDGMYMPVIVQMMITPLVSGIMSLVDPNTGDPNTLVIEANWGSNKYVSRGFIVPDRYYVDKNNGRLRNMEIANKTRMVVPNEEFEGRLVEEEVAEGMRLQPCLTHDKVAELFNYGATLERFYGSPQFVEWLIDKITGRLFISETRLIPSTKKGTYIKSMREESDILLRGIPASPGYVYGRVRIVRTEKEIDGIKPGEIMVIPEASPIYSIGLSRVSAVVSNFGGGTCHLANLCREANVPAVMGTNIATDILTDGMEVVVDSNEGIVYKQK